jgi:hypothetical protein
VCVSVSAGDDSSFEMPHALVGYISYVLIVWLVQ